MTPFEKIYREHFHAVFLFLRKISQDEKLAEDLAAETFFKALNSLESFDGSCEVRVWLCQIAKNCYISHWRKQGRVILKESIDEMPVFSEEDMTENIMHKESAEQIHKALHQLREPYREVFSLRIFAELSFKQIGDLFGKTDNWACVTFHRAKGQIQQKLEERK